jgi:Stage II sporulation protein E (SpoIIE)/NACHT domain/CHAT domain
VIKVLLFAANPRGTAPLDLPREFREIDEEVRLGTFRDAIELVLVPGTRPVDLLRKLNESQPQVVHFSSHGSPEEILLEAEDAQDEVSDLLGTTPRSASERDMTKVGRDQVEGVGPSQGGPQAVRGAALVDVLRSCNEGNLRLVVLNACDTRPLAMALTEVVDCVVSMNQTITDRAAIKFAASFYGALAFGRSVQKAFDQGVARLSAEALTESGTPELLVRSGVDASRVVLVRSATGDGGGMAAQYFAVQREAIEEHVRRFVGRVAVSRALDRFLAREPRGYFLIRGGPGQGKSAVACQLIKSRGWPHHLISRTGGRSDVRLVLRSLISQLVTGMGSDGPLPDSVPELAKALEDRLARAAAKSGRLVVVFDGLDELVEEVGQDPPFLVTEGLPPNVYVVVTARPGDRLDRLLEALHSMPHELYELGPLEPPEVATILRSRRPDLDDAKIALAAKASRGNPLFLRAVADELERNAHYDLRDLPASIEGFFRLALCDLNGRRDPLLTVVLGLLATARKPLTLRELGQIVGTPQREIHQRGIRPIRQFLLDLDEGYGFYHARFHEFVTNELLYEDELPRYHASLACWLRRPECLSSDYRYLALAYHLDRAGDRDGLWATVEPNFLREKVRHCGYTVLEDVVLLSRTAIDAADPSQVGRCIELVEGLREIVGGDLIDEARLAIQGRRLAATATRDRIEAPKPPRVAGMNLYIGMLPKTTVGADFVEALRLGDGLMLALGDAPGVGLKGAFVARFVGGLVRRLAERPGALPLGELLEEVERILALHPFFDPISLQCVAVDPSAGTLAIAGAGHPHPVFYSARRGRCDRLPVGDELLLVRQRVGQPAARRRQRRAEIGPGDFLVMVSDGLTESHGMAADPYGYRFERLIPALVPRGARAIGEAILEDWLIYSEGADYIDDVTVVVIAMNEVNPTGFRPED